MQKMYLFTVRANLEGPVVDGFHEVDTGNEKETATVMHAMRLRALANQLKGPCVVKADIEKDYGWTADLLQVWLRSLSREKLQQFLKDTDLSNKLPNLPPANPRLQK